MGNGSFQSRLAWIIGARDKHPWGRALGLSGTRITTMFRGQIPTADALLRIHAAERCNLDWLLTGEGAPFLVSGADDAATAAALDAEPITERWRAYLVRAPGPDPGAVLCAWPARAAFADDAEPATFTGLRIYAHGGPLTLRALNRVAVVLALAVSVAELASLRAGQIGPRHLLIGTDESPPWIARGVLLEADDLGRIAEAASAYGGRPPDEVRLLACYRALCPPRREALLVLLEGVG